MRPALKKPVHLHVVVRGHSPEQLKELSSNHFGDPNRSQFFFLIGSFSGSQTKFAHEIDEQLGIPESALRHLQRYEESDLVNVLDVATNPNCIGVFAFGLEKNHRELLKKSLDDHGVGAIKGDPDGDTYAIFSNSRRMRPKELVENLRKLLALFFDKEHLRQERP